MISNIEFRLVSAFFVLMLVLSVSPLVSYFAFEYNKGVQHEQYEAQRIANNQPKISFGLGFCDICYSPAYEKIIPFQLLFVGAAFGLFRMRNAISQALSTLVLFIVLAAYYEWIADAVRWPDDIHLTSHIWEIVLLLGMVGLTSIQTFILLRAGAERNQSKPAPLE